MLAISSQTGQECIALGALIDYSLNVQEPCALVCVEPMEAIARPVGFAVKPKVDRRELIFTLKQYFGVMLD